MELAGAICGPSLPDGPQRLALALPVPTAPSLALASSKLSQSIMMHKPRQAASVPASLQAARHTVSTSACQPHKAAASSTAGRRSPAGMQQRHACCRRQRADGAALAAPPPLPACPAGLTDTRIHSNYIQLLPAPSRLGTTQSSHCVCLTCTCLALPTPAQQRAASRQQQHAGAGPSPRHVQRKPSPVRSCSSKMLAEPC